MFVPLGMRKFSALLTACMATAVSGMAFSQMAAPVMAGPMMCTTTLEAPHPSAGSGLVPVEVNLWPYRNNIRIAQPADVHLDSALCSGH